VKIFGATIVFMALYATSAAAQSSADLSSADFSRRDKAARTLGAKTPLTSEAKTTLINLLAREKGLAEPALASGARPSGNDASEAATAAGEAYGEYRSWLMEEVMKIADAEPDRTDVWRALLGAEPGDGYNAYGQWLGTHGDKTLPWLLAYAKDNRTDSLSVQNRHDSLTSLAQIIAYERRPETAHHLSASDLQTAESAIRDALNDPNPIIRSGGVVALSILDDPKDLPMLDQIALTDEDVSQTGPPTGTEIVFPIRMLARDIAKRIRAELAAGPNSK
jgi:hypothetical protein